MNDLGDEHMKELVEIVNNKELNEKILNEMYPSYTFNDPIRKEKSLKDIEWTLLFIVESIKADNLKLLDNYFIWLTKLFRGLDLDYLHIPLLLKSIKKVLREEYDSKEIIDFLNKVELQPNKEKNELLNNNPFLKEKEEYLQAILGSDRIRAEKVVNSLLDESVSIEDIYIYIFQETMRHVGMLWHEGTISVGREHYCTAVTQYFMSTMYPQIFNSIKKEKRLLACSVGSELHEMGIRMVADLFELHGWDTNYLGANIPSTEIIDFAKEFKPNIIALSITMPYHLSLLTDVVKDIKNDKDLKGVKIIVGGQPFINNIELNEIVGADAVAIDAIEGIKVANGLL